MGAEIGGAGRDGRDTGDRPDGAVRDGDGVNLRGAAGWGRPPSRRFESPTPKTGDAGFEPVAGVSTGAVSGPAGASLVDAGFRRSGPGIETSGAALSDGLPSCRIGRAISSAGSVLQ